MSKTITATYSIGDRVAVILPQTNEKAAPATIEKAANGWFVCRLDQPELYPLAKDGIVSARKDRMVKLQPAGPAPEQAPADPAPAAKQPALPDECPECGGSDLELGEEHGFVCLECDHEWLPDDEEDLDDDEGDVEEALDEAEEHASKMAEALRKARVRYVKDRRPSGAATAHNGDLIAKELRDYDPLDVCRLADRCLEQPIGWHAARYEGLNNGQIRMNAGNKIRGAWKKAHSVAADHADYPAAQATIARISRLLNLTEESDDGEQA